MLRPTPLPLRLKSVACAAALCAALAPATGAEETPLAALPYVPALDVASMDRSVNPCEDFYQYSCGGWIKANPIPPDQSRWSVYAKLANENQRYLWGVLQNLAEQKDGSASQRQLGDYFAACMDTEAIDATGMAPLKPWLARIDALRKPADVATLLGEMKRDWGQSVLLDFVARQDFSDAERVITFVAAAGLGLPDRDDYLRADAKSREVLAKYRAHVARTLTLAGQSEADAARAAARVVAMETSLARAHLTRVQLRDPYATKHPMTPAELQRLTPAFDWVAFRREAGAAPGGAMNVEQPAYMRAVERLLRSAPLADIKTYLKWQVAREMAPHLSAPWRNAHFDFYEHTLKGTPEPKARWKTCVQLADQQLGEALGKEFVERSFSADTKARVMKMTEQIEAAMAKRIAQLDWMSAPTKANALKKLHTIVNKVGYPERWRDYSGLRVARNDFAGNVQRGQAFESARDLAKIGKPLDRGEWGMTPQTVNAYYDAQMNDINFPAAVLLPPLYDAKIDDAPSYGNTGGTIGHELTHGFDDEGRQFDAKGKLSDWWTKKDAAEFAKRASCITKQYAQYKVVDDIRINSQLTLGEDLADFGGMELAWMAWQVQTENQRLQPQQGLTPEQRFFVGFAQWDCSDTRPEAARLHARTDPHSPGRYRINGVVVNMEQFADAFSCKAGQPMVKPEAERCKVW